MKDDTGWVLTDLVVNRQTQIPAKTEPVFTFPLVGDDRFWKINRISVAGIPQSVGNPVTVFVQIIEPSDPTTFPDATETYVDTLETTPNLDAFVAVGNYPEPGLWVPAGTYLVLTVNGASFLNCAARLQYESLESTG